MLLLLLLSGCVRTRRSWLTASCLPMSCNLRLGMHALPSRRRGRRIVPDICSFYVPCDGVCRPVSRPARRGFWVRHRVVPRRAGVPLVRIQRGQWARWATGQPAIHAIAAMLSCRREVVRSAPPTCGCAASPRLYAFAILCRADRDVAAHGGVGKARQCSSKPARWLESRPEWIGGVEIPFDGDIRARGGPSRVGCRAAGGACVGRNGERVALPETCRVCPPGARGAVADRDRGRDLGVSHIYR